MKTLINKLNHSRIAYFYAIKSLPIKENIKFPFEKNGVVFSNESEIDSMLIEYGWSFYCRYEAIFEVFLKENEVKLNKNLSIIQYLEQNNIDIPKNFNEGLIKYRSIRNSLHHEDGETLDKTPGKEIHLYPEHLENYFNLFIWVGEKIINAKLN